MWLPAPLQEMKNLLRRAILSGMYRIFNPPDTGSCSRYDFAKYVLNQIGWSGILTPAKSSDFQTPAARPEYSVLDNFGLRQAIGYTLPSWEDATARCLHEIGRI